MTVTWGKGFWKLGLVSFVAMGGAIASSRDCAHAQVIPDGTLGAESSVVTPTNVNGLSNNQIDGGATRGANLFHSFNVFSVPTGGAASFNNALSIQNIISRVTGGSISNIDGLLRANGTANLFLLNPNGIIFGPNASLDIGGSFVGSTASSINFADRTSFSATAPTTTPLLSVSVPLGLQYEANPGRIQVQGDGQGTRTTTELIDTTVGLRVQPNQTLALVGGDIALLGGTLKTAGGRIELGSVAGPGLVNLTPIDSGWALGYESVPTFGDIQLSGTATVDASGAGGGNIQVQGRQITLTNGSQIEASTLGAEPGGTLSVTAKESVELSGESAERQLPSALAAQVYSGATGNGGNLTVETGRLNVRNGARISTSTRGTGAGGRLSVTASDVVELIGRSANVVFGSGLYSETFGGGNAGNLTIATGRLTVRDGAEVSNITRSTGDGGRLSVTASDVVELIGRSVNDQFTGGLYASTFGDGNAGDLTIATGRLNVRDGASVSTVTWDTGAGGTLSVTASDVVELIGTSANGWVRSGLSAQSEGDGNAGDLTIATGRLTMRDGASASTVTFGSGAGGTLSVTASDAVEVIGTSANGLLPSGLYANTQGAGDAANVTIATRRLTVRDGAQVSAGTFDDTGAGGTLSVTASDVVEVIGTSADGFYISSLSAQTFFGGGNAGDLTITTGRLTVRDGAQVAVNSRGWSYVPDEAQVAVRSRGLGNAGSLRVAAGSVLLENQGKLLASTASGEGGNIDLQVQDLILMRSNSLISAGVEGTGNGGNITINAPSIVAVPSENSDIFASTIQGRGGNIFITAQGIYGLEYRSNQTLESDINASSRFGVSGTVEINNLDVDPTQGLVELPAEVVDASNSIATDCTAGGENEFIITGRGGLPPNPRQVLRSNAVQVDWVELDAADLNRASVERRSRRQGSSPINRYNKADVNHPIREIVEAQRWIVDANGSVTLVATAPTAMPPSSWQTPVDCRKVGRQH